MRRVDARTYPIFRQIPLAWERENALYYSYPLEWTRPNFLAPRIAMVLVAAVFSYQRSGSASK